MTTTFAQFVKYAKGNNVSKEDKIKKFEEIKVVNGKLDEKTVKEAFLLLAEAVLPKDKFKKYEKCIEPVFSAAKIKEDSDDEPWDRDIADSPWTKVADELDTFNNAFVPYVDKKDGLKIAGIGHAVLEALRN